MFVPMIRVKAYPAVFRVYEHEVIRVGEDWGGSSFLLQHFESLVALAETLGDRYFRLGHRSVRFRHYVGIISTPLVTIEILPKTDRHTAREAGDWQRILVDMLRACRFVRQEIPGHAFLDNRPGYLLDWYIDLFLQELEALRRNGLLHNYREQSSNQRVWKGQLQFAQQIKHNHLHQERFFVRYHEFSHRHPANLMLSAAMQRLQYLPLHADLLARLRHLLRSFPKVGEQKEWWTFHRDIAWLGDRQLDHYQQALTFAHHILQDRQPDVRSGPQAGLALLFDMNALFEEYLYRQLLRDKPQGCAVERQLSRVFWGQNRLRPDLVITTPHGRWVLDTKWRIPEGRQPSAEELRQIYVYCDYFKADHGVLIYPRVDQQQLSQRLPFSALPGHSSSQGRSCQVYFAPVINETGRLDPELGKMIFEELFKRI